MITYHVTATRTGRWWALQCVEQPGALSQVSRLDQAADMIREAIAFVAEQDPASFDIEVQPTLPDAYTDEMAAAAERREVARTANAAAAEHARTAAGVLAEAGLTTRDIGAVMGVSHQRAAQLLAG